MAIRMTTASMRKYIHFSPLVNSLICRMIAARLALLIGSSPTIFANAAFSSSRVIVSRPF